jgi:hypothetical protein
MKRHRFDALSFVAGVLAMATGLVFLVAAEPTDIVDVIVNMGEWFWPAVLLAVGLAIVVPVLVSGPRTKPSDGLASDGLPQGLHRNEEHKTTEHD